MRAFMKDLYDVLKERPCESCKHKWKSLNQPPCKNCEIVVVPTKYEAQKP